MRLWPSATLIQGMNTALFDLIGKHKIDPARMRKVRIGLSQQAFAMHGGFDTYKAKFEALLVGALHRRRHPARPRADLGAVRAGALRRSEIAAFRGRAGRGPRRAVGRRLAGRRRHRYRSTARRSRRVASIRSARSKIRCRAAQIEQKFRTYAKGFLPDSACCRRDRARSTGWKILARSPADGFAARGVAGNGGGRVIYCEVRRSWPATTFPSAPTRSGLAQLNERSREIFRQVVESYLATGEPVGSRNLSRIIPMTLSPASVRNVMSDLEQLGLVYAPHTSAGRLPTEKGLRFFVDALMQIGDLTENDRKAIEAQVAASGQSKSVETVLTEASGLLSGLTPRRRRRADGEIQSCGSSMSNSSGLSPNARWSSWLPKTARSRTGYSIFRSACRPRR